MDTRQLKLFLNVCYTQDFSETGRNLYISRSAVIQRINKLESALNVKLFNRTTHGVSLTEAGKALKPMAKQILNEETEIIEVMQDYSKTLTVGTIYQQNPVIINKFLEEHPEIADHINIQFQEIKEVSDINNKIDIIEYYEVTKYLDQSFDFITLKLEPIYVAIPPDKILGKKKIINLSDLNGMAVDIEKEGVSLISDKIKDTIEKKYPRIKLKSFGIYNSSFFATARLRHEIIIIAQGMQNYVKPFVVRPLNIKEKAQYGLYYRKKTSKLVTDFMKNFK